MHPKPLMSIGSGSRSNYPGETIQHCEKITKNDATTLYGPQITGKELVFDMSGKFLEVKPD